MTNPSPEKGMRECIRHSFWGKYFHKCIYYQTNQPREKKNKNPHKGYKN